MEIPCSPLDALVKAKIGVPAHAELTRRALSAYQLEKLWITLDYVKQSSPFYRRRFAGHDPRSIQRPEDLARWPMTAPDDLRKDPLALLCVSQSAVERVVTLPTRSPDEPPIRLFFSSADLELAVDFFHHGFSTLVAPHQRMLVVMPCRQPYSVGDLLARGLARIPVQVVAHGPLESPEAALEAVVKEDIDCMVGIPTEMAALARHPAAARIPRGQIRSVWLGNQNGRREVAQEIGRAWDCPVYQHYGASEMCPGGGVECAVRDGFHLREGDLLIEVVDPGTGRPAPAGAQGEVVVTTLTRQAMPLVRYRTGHVAALLTAPCPCGSRLHRLTAISSHLHESM